MSEPPSPWTFTAELWEWDARKADTWVFVTLPAELAEEIRLVAEPRGFGSVKVRVTVGPTTWDTSVFPDAGRGSYVLPVKKAVRRAVAAEAGDPVEVDLRLL